MALFESDPFLDLASLPESVKAKYQSDFAPLTKGKKQKSSSHVTPIKMSLDFGVTSAEAIQSNPSEIETTKEASQ